MKRDKQLPKGQFYTETSLMRVLIMLDQLINLTITSPVGFEVVKSFANPKNLSQLLELSVQSSIRN